MTLAAQLLPEGSFKDKIIVTLVLLDRVYIDEKSGEASVAVRQHAHARMHKCRKMCMARSNKIVFG